MQIESFKKTCGNDGFHILTVEQKISVIELFSVQGKQEDTSWNNFTT